MQWQAVIFAVALIVSVISPFVTSVLNNIHERKMWERRKNHERRDIAIQNYIQKCGLALKRDAGTYVKEYSENYGEIFLFAPKELWSDIEKLDYYITNRIHGNEPTQLFVKICKSLSEN